MTQQNHIKRLIEDARKKAAAFEGLPKHKQITGMCSMFNETDIGNAARLVLRHGHKFRFVEGEKGVQRDKQGEIPRQSG